LVSCNFNEFREVAEMA